MKASGLLTQLAIGWIGVIVIGSLTHDWSLMIGGGVVFSLIAIGRYYQSQGR